MNHSESFHAQKAVEAATTASYEADECDKDVEEAKAALAFRQAEAKKAHAKALQLGDAAAIAQQNVSSTQRPRDVYMQWSKKWLKMWDETENSYYYYNTITGGKTWDAPWGYEVFVLILLSN